MHKNKKEKGDFFNYLYQKVSFYLSKEDVKNNDLHDLTIYFVIFLEKVLKMKLFKKNRLLIYNKLEDDKKVFNILSSDKNSHYTINILNLIDRYCLFYKKDFNQTDLIILKEVIEIRNELVHSCFDYKVTDSDDLIKKIGRLWLKLGKILRKQKIQIMTNVEMLKIKEYSDEELEEKILNELKKKINFNKTTLQSHFNYDYKNAFEYPWVNSFSKCPRCGMEFLKIREDGNHIYGITNLLSFDPLSSISYINENNALYKCSKCDLELTPNEFKLYLKNKNIF